MIPAVSTNGPVTFPSSNVSVDINIPKWCKLRVEHGILEAESETQASKDGEGKERKRKEEKKNGTDSRD